MRSAPGRSETDYTRLRSTRIVEEAYRRYHHPRYIHPDPLEIVLRYPRGDDREVAGIICASFALGRVRSILRACSEVLARLDDAGAPGPAAVLRNAGRDELEQRFEGFVYRFFGSREASGFLFAVGETLRRYGSIESAFIRHFSPADPNVLPALGRFSEELSAYAEGRHGLLIARVARGSAAKRWHLFLRWMVRADGIDPGGWSRVPASHLVVPMDTHMHRICTVLGLIARRNADEKATVAATEFFRTLDPTDPVRFDFSLSRMGIHPQVAREGESILSGAKPGFSIHV
ncbi:MAG: TIGR02757 family protein [Spirochaetaceae bacterium]